MAHIVVITGLAGCGKSTVGRALAERFDASFHLKVDDLREGMVRGFEFPSALPFAAGVATQFRVARDTASFMARTYADAGITFVIDDTPLPPDIADWYAALFTDPRVVRILLMTDGSVRTARIRARHGAFDEQILAVPAEAFDAYMATVPTDGWIVVDNSNLTVDETVDEIVSHLSEAA